MTDDLFARYQKLPASNSHRRA